jgi:hypothetical protein
MKKQRTIKRRKRLEGAIAKAAENDPYAGTESAGYHAKELARFGRERTEIEKLVWFYRHTAEAWPREYSKWPEPDRGKVALCFWQDAINLCDLLLDIAVKHDTKRLKAVARAVEAARLDARPVRPDWELILSLKSANEPSGGTPLTNTQIARILYPRCNHPELSEKTYSALLRSHLRTLQRIRGKVAWRAKGGRPKTRTDKTPKAL